MLIKRKSIENEQAHRRPLNQAPQAGPDSPIDASSGQGAEPGYQSEPESTSSSRSRSRIKAAGSGSVTRSRSGSRPRSKSSESQPTPRRRKPKFAPVTLSEMDGVRYLHFGTEWVQGAMRVRRPNWIELEYAQQMMAWMLFLDAPHHIVQLGLGTGALTKFCHQHCPAAQVTAVELNPAVIRVCADMFKLPPEDDRLSVLEMDALDYIGQAAAHPGTIDVLQIDLYDATARGPVLDTPEFYADCAAALAPDGIATVNLFGDHPSFRRNLKAMRHAFDTVITLPEVHDGNIVALCFNTPPLLDFTQLYQVAAVVAAETRLPARSWVNGIKAWQQGGA